MHDDNGTSSINPILQHYSHQLHLVCTKGWGQHAPSCVPVLITGAKDSSVLLPLHTSDKEPILTLQHETFILITALLLTPSSHRTESMYTIRHAWLAANYTWTSLTIHTHAWVHMHDFEHTHASMQTHKCAHYEHTHIRRQTHTVHMCVTHTSWAHALPSHVKVCKHLLQLYGVRFPTTLSWRIFDASLTP